MAKSKTADQATPPVDNAAANVGAPANEDNASGAAAPTEAPTAAPKAKPALPAQVTLSAPYAFFDDENQFRSWNEGQVVTDAEHVETLITRGAPLAE